MHAPCTHGRPDNCTRHAGRNSPLRVIGSPRERSILGRNSLDRTAAEDAMMEPSARDLQTENFRQRLLDHADVEAAGVSTKPDNGADIAACRPGWSWRIEAVLVGRMLSSSYLSILIVFVPLGILSGVLGWSAQPVFVMVGDPLAAMSFERPPSLNVMLFLFSHFSEPHLSHSPGAFAGGRHRGQ